MATNTRRNGNVRYRIRLSIWPNAAMAGARKATRKPRVLMVFRPEPTRRCGHAKATESQPRGRGECAGFGKRLDVGPGSIQDGTLGVSSVFVGLVAQNFHQGARSEPRRPPGAKLIFDVSDAVDFTAQSALPRCTPDFATIRVNSGATSPGSNRPSYDRNAISARHLELLVQQQQASECHGGQDGRNPD